MTEQATQNQGDSFNASFEEAIRAGFSQGKQELDFAEEARWEKKQQEERDVAAAFDTAAGLVEGLTILRGMKGSTFQFNLVAQRDCVHIDTNIPVYSQCSEDYMRWGYDEIENTLSIVCRGDGRISVSGDRDSDGKYDEVSARKGGPKAEEKIVAFTAKYAVKRGCAY